MKRIKEALKELKILCQLLWQKKEKRYILIILSVVGIVLLGFTAWRWVSPPPAAGYPEITYREFKNQIAAGNIQSFSLKYCDEKDVAKEYKSGLVTIFLQLKNEEKFATKELSLAKIPATDFVNYIQKNSVEYVVVRYKQEVGGFQISFVIFGELKTGKVFIAEPSQLLKPEELFNILREKNTKFYEVTVEEGTEIKAPQLGFFEKKWNLTALTGLFWLGLIIFFLILAFRIKKSTAGVLLGTKGKKGSLFTSFLGRRVTFQDVAGIDEAKQDLEEVLQFLRFPDKFIKMGARMPKGLLLVGPPGTGKTLLARALACEAGVPFKGVSGSEFVEKYVGVGASRIRDLFREAKSVAKIEKTAYIIFIDEIDAIGKRTSDDDNAEYHQTLTQFLTEMDGFEPTEKILVIAATNQPEGVDPAILRPGRFDRQIVLPLPDLKGRKAILEVHTKNKPLAVGVNLEKVAQATPLGFSGADLANVANEAAIRATLSNKEAIEEKDFEKAIEKVLVGSERKSMTMGEEDRWIIAYHETGHVLVAKFNPNVNLPQKVTIVPTVKGAGGYTRFLSREEKFMFTKEDLLAQIQGLLGGRIAEEIISGKEKVSTGAGDDLERATKIAEQMICDYAMADEELGLGLRTFGKRQGFRYLGGYSRQKDYSEEDAQKISKATNLILEKCSQKAESILEENRDILVELAKVLKEKETLDISEINEVCERVIKKRNIQIKRA